MSKISDQTENSFHEVGRMERNSRGDQIVVGISTYNGNEYLDARLHMVTESGDLVPTKKGISLPEEMVNEFRDLIIKVALFLENTPSKEPKKPKTK